MPGIAVVVVTPEREVFSGDADMVVAHGVDGDVGILPHHAPMLIQLGEAPVRILEGQREVSIQVNGGFLHVSPGEDVTRVDVLAERAEAAPE
jgi:F-type H+-transporting ATPase subunit epsilon